jgi:hypothetical protein
MEATSTLAQLLQSERSKCVQKARNARRNKHLVLAAYWTGKRKQCDDTLKLITPRPVRHDADEPLIYR